jgi:hypothetical protein
MVTNNVHTADGLVNGVVGLLKQIDYSDKNEVLRVWFESEDESTGKEARQAVIQYCCRHNIPPNWVPINFLKSMIKIGKSSTSIIVRRQLPLRIAEAITVHKSEGSTYSDIAIHQPETLSRKEFYTAASRVTSLSGLFFVDCKKPFNLKKYNNTENDRGKKEIEYLEAQRPLKFNLQFLQDYPQYPTFIFANIQSLHKYFLLMKADKCFLSADFILFVETWTVSQDQYILSHYNCIYRHDCLGQKRHAYGIAIYAKQLFSNGIKIIFESNKYNRSKHLAHNIVSFTTDDKYCFCVIYRSPSESMENFKKIFQEMMSTVQRKLSPSAKIIVVGDFNYDISTENQGKLFLKMFENY